MKFSNKSLIGIAALPALGVAMPCSSLYAANNNAKQSKPNVVVIMVDDMGYGIFPPNAREFGVEDMNADFIAKYKPGYTPEQALEAMQKALPNLTRYSDEGVRFTNAYVTANVSGPSRTGFLTSAHQQRLGIYINQEAEDGVPTEIKLMPKVLQENGYVTGVFGKYHIGKATNHKTWECAEGHHPLDRGFDRYYGFNCHGTTYYNSPMIFSDYDNEIQNPEDYTTDRFTEEAVKFIEENQGKPKLVYIPYNAVHGPLSPKSPAPEKYTSRFNYKAPVLNFFASYAAAVDDGVEAVMSKLREIGEADNTILIFFSDNGAAGGAGSTLPSNAPFSGFKGQSYQGGYHTPMFYWYGDNIKCKGSVSDMLVSSMDIFPTIFDIAGITPELSKNQVIDGESLAPYLIDGDSTPIHDHLILLSQQAENWAGGVKDQGVAQAAFMVRRGDYSLRYIMEEDSYYLHNVAEDRAEKINIADEFPQEVEEMKQLFKEWFLQMGTPIKWNAKLWQNVQFWKSNLPKPPYIDREAIASKTN